MEIARHVRPFVRDEADPEPASSREPDSASPDRAPKTYLTARERGVLARRLAVSRTRVLAACRGGSSARLAFAIQELVAAVQRRARPSDAGVEGLLELCLNHLELLAVYCTELSGWDEEAALVVVPSAVAALMSCVEREANESEPVREVPANPTLAAAAERLRRVPRGFGTREWMLSLLYAAGDNGATLAELRQWVRPEARGAVHAVSRALVNAGLVVAHGAVLTLSGRGSSEVHGRGLLNALDSGG